MSKHTPGPWEALVDKRQARGGSWMAMVVTGAGSQAADFTNSGDTRAETAANARLAAAAPDLLEACKYALANNPMHQDTVDRLRAAIAKAEGK